MNILNQIKPIITNEDNIIFAYIFGSYAKGDFLDSSDVDIALYLRNDSFDYQLQIIKKLNSKIHQDIDLVILNRAKNLFLIEDIINNSIIIKDHPRRIEYETYRWMEIVDFKELDKRLERCIA